MSDELVAHAWACNPELPLPTWVDPHATPLRAFRLARASAPSLQNLYNNLRLDDPSPGAWAVVVPDASHRLRLVGVMPVGAWCAGAREGSFLIQGGEHDALRAFRALVRFVGEQSRERVDGVALVGLDRAGVPVVCVPCVAYMSGAHPVWCSERSARALEVIVAFWLTGRWRTPGAWRALDSGGLHSGRAAYLEVVTDRYFHARTTPQRAARVARVDGEHVDCAASLLLALGEAFFGPGGYMGWSICSMNEQILGGDHEGFPAELVITNARHIRDRLDVTFWDEFLACWRLYDVFIHLQVEA